jgi:adenosylcobinamide-GDP ribazoletransferase
MKKLFEHFILLWTLITRIPVPGFFLPEAFTIPSADAMILMPLVGALFGFIATLPAWLAAMVISKSGAAWIACGLYTILGWSLHLDGWGDMWDGIGSGKRGDALRSVMKDSRVGAFGVAGIALAIGTRAALLSEIDTAFWLRTCIVSCGVGRFGADVTVFFGIYPWNEGMGHDIVRNFGRKQLACSFVVACLLFPFAPIAWTIGMITAGVAGTVLALWTNKNLGGANGDIIGASAVLCEILAMVACSI